MEIIPNTDSPGNELIMYAVLADTESSPVAPDRVLYSLTVGDVQTVAEEEFGLEMTAEEINKIERLIDFDWYETLRKLILAVRG